MLVGFDASMLRHASNNNSNKLTKAQMRRLSSSSYTNTQQRGLAKNRPSETTSPKPSLVPAQLPRRHVGPVVILDVDVTLVGGKFDVDKKNVESITSVNA